MEDNYIMEPNSNQKDQFLNPYNNLTKVNQPFLSPQHSNTSQFTTNHTQRQSNFATTNFQHNRHVFASMIQPQSSSSSESSGLGGLGKLSNMGRIVNEDPDPIIRIQPPPTAPQPTTNTLNFRSPNQKLRMASSMIISKNEDTNKFGQGGFGTTRLQAMMNKGKNVQQAKESMDQRKRQIGTIKEELNKLNKRMQSFNFKKNQVGTTQNKQYFQLPSRKTSAMVHPTHSQITSDSESTTTTTSNQQEMIRPKQEEPTMFKKKSPMHFDNNQSNNPPKTFLLSPKGMNKPVIKQQLTNDYKPAQSANIQQAMRQFLPTTEVKPTQRQSNLGLFKRSDSNSFESSKKEEVKVKEFKKSDFAVGKKMGKGQFGQVMLVVHKDTGFLCGMKVMSKKQIRQQRYENQIARELSIQFYLSHRNVSPLYGYFTDEENIYLLIQFATGGQLLEMLRKERRMEEPEVSPIIRQICEGLDYIHKEQIIHRDIKPENILFNFDTVKICDFGWAVHCGTGMRQTVAGSPLYYSPQIVKETKYDQKIDIWAIGMMTYECILGKIPFRIYSELDLQRIVEDDIKFPQYVDVTDDTKDFILGICKKNPDDRMDMRDILRHPFIKKYLKHKKVDDSILEEFRKVLN